MSLTIHCWLQGPMTRVFPDDRPPRQPAGRFQVSAARGETECFQVGVRTSGIAPDFMNGEYPNYLEAKLLDLRAANGASIPAGSVDLLYPEFVPVKWVQSGQTAADVERMPPAFFPDPLMPDWIMETAGPVASPTRSVWVRIRIPRHARPGLYIGRLAITVGRRNLRAENQANSVMFKRDAQVTFRLRVWDFELPRRTGLLTTNWLFPDQFATWYGIKPWSPDHWRWMERVARDMQDHRQNVVLTPLLGGADAESQMVGVRQNGKRYAFDFRRLERWVRLFLGHGFELIEGMHIASGCKSPIDPVVFWASDHRGKCRPVNCGSLPNPKYADFLRQFFAALWRFLGQCGWQRRWIQHISDEAILADLATYKWLTEAVRAAAPGVKLLDAVFHPEIAALDDYPVPIENSYEKTVKECGVPRKNIWIYYCCGPGGKWPNRFVEYWLIRLRIISWICFQKEIPGFLHWGYNAWTAVRKKVHNPWDDPSTHRHPCGDGLMIYPARDDRMNGAGIIGSIRWEIFREAMEDYEYLRLVKGLADDGNRAAAKILAEVAAKVVPDWTTHTRNWKYLCAIRERMGELLEKCGK